MKSYRLWIAIILCVITIQLVRASQPFIPTTIINLDRSPDRMLVMSIQCFLYGIPYKRWAAIDGATYKFTEEEKSMLFGIASDEPGLKTKYSKTEIDSLFAKRESEPGFKKTKKIMACALSHIQVWKSYKHTNEPVLIMEDDTILDPHLRQDIKDCLDMLESVDPDWHIIWISGGKPGDRERVGFWNSHDIYRMDPPEYIGQGTVGYILSPKGIEFFLNKLNLHGCSYASDTFLFEHLDVKHAYGTTPALISSGGIFNSTITM